MEVQSAYVNLEVIWGVKTDMKQAYLGSDIFQ